MAYKCLKPLKKERRQEAMMRRAHTGGTRGNLADSLVAAALWRDTGMPQ
jgi:hypothetical protein